MIFGWALLALSRGLLYLPVHKDYGDFPLPLTYVFDVGHVWICGVVWIVMAALGIATALWRKAPWWVEQAWWPVLLGGIAAWGGMYLSSLLIPGGTFKLVVAGWFYIIVAYVMWATKGHPPVTARPNAWRQRRDHTPPGRR